MTLGASLGSFAAAAVAGYIRPEDGMAAVLEQARAIAACGPGGMRAVLAEPSLFDEPPLRGRSQMAGINVSAHFALAGRDPDLAAIAGLLEQRGVTCQRLAVKFAFHSDAIDPAEGALARCMDSLILRAGRLPIACCEQGRVVNALPHDFFWRAVRRPMRLCEVLAQLERQGPMRYIDAGPSGTMATFVKYGLPPGSRSSAQPLLTPYGRDSSNLAALASTTTETRWPTGIAT